MDSRMIIGNYSCDYQMIKKPHQLPLLIQRPKQRYQMIKQFEYYHPPPMIQVRKQEFCDRSLQHASGSTKAFSKQTPNFQTAQAKSEHRTQLPIKSFKSSETKLFRVRTQPERSMFVTPLYSNILSPSFPNLHQLKEVIKYDFSLFKQKLNFHFPNRDPNSFEYISFSSLPFFLGSCTYSGAPLPPIDHLLRGDSISHFLTTHEGRRRFSRLPKVYHIHRNLLEMLLPYTPRPNSDRASVLDCPYKCKEFHQSCSWHFDLRYDPLIANERALLHKVLSDLSLLDSSEFWISLGQVYLDQSYFFCDPSYDEPTHLLLNLRLDGALPPIVEANDPRLTNQEARGYWMKLEEVQIAQADEEMRWRCVPCNLRFPSRSLFQSHLRTTAHVEVTFSSRPSIASLEDEHVSFSRSYITSKLSDLLNSLSDVRDAMPRWIKAHMRFLVNLMCNCVTIMTSKAWPAVIAAISSMVNEVLHEFPQLLRERVDALVKCFKQVIWRFFPHAQAQPTVAHDHLVANESFIKSLFSILSSLLPGVTVDSQLLKSRVQRIQLLSVCLSSAKQIGEWFCMLFDKLWTWIQIYWYGATSEELARAKTLLASPEIQTWINDVTSFELGGKGPDGKEKPPGITRLLVDNELQDYVVDLRQRGEEIYATVSASDQVAKTRLAHLVQMHLRKVDRWYKMFEDSRGQAENKHEPFVIYLHGDPGVGKTYCVNYLCQILARVAGRNFDPAKDIFSKPRDSAFHDGYNNQFCYLLDDFMQVANQQGNQSELSFLIDAGSRAKYHLDMAVLDRKATSYFNSPLVIVTSNQQLHASAFETLLISFPALARRIDLSIEVRRMQNWSPDPTKVFDPSGLFFEMSKFKFVKDNYEGGVWERVGLPCDWNMLIHTASVLFAKKMKRQADLDHLEPLPEHVSSSVDSVVQQYRASNAPEKEIINQIFTQHGANQETVTWATTCKDAKTNQKVRREDPVMTVKQSDTSFWGVSPVGSVTALSVENGMESDEELSEHIRRMENILNAAEDSLSVKSAPPEVQTAQAGAEDATEYMDHPRYCPVRGCSFHFIEGYHRTQVYAHFVDEARQRTAIGDLHAAYSENLEPFLNIFPLIESAPLTRLEKDWYEYIQNQHYEYEPRGSCYNLSELNAKGYHDMIRVVIGMYIKFEYNPLWSTILGWPVRAYNAVFGKMRESFVAASRKMFSPVRPVLELVKEAQNIVKRVKANLGRIALIGVLCTIFSSLVSISLVRWLIATRGAPLEDKVQLKAQKKRNNVQSEAFVSGDLRVAAKKARRQIQRIECKCVSNVSFQSLLNSIELARVDISDDPDLIIFASGDKLSLTWNNGAVDELENPQDVKQRSILISKAISSHYKKEEPKTEAKQDRMEMVESLIGKYPATEAARDPSAMDIIQNLGANLVKVHNMRNGLTLNGVIIQNAIAMFPRHLFGEEIGDGLPLIITTMEGQTQIKLGGDYRWIDCPEKDTVFVDLAPTHVHTRRSLVKKFINGDSELRVSDGYLLVPSYDQSRTRLGFAVAKHLRGLTTIERSEYLDTKKGEMTQVVGALSYNGDSQPGDCGSLVVKVDSMCVRKLMGFHVAGSVGAGTAMLWTEDKLREVLARFQETQAVMDCEINNIDLDEFYDCVESFEDEEKDEFRAALTYCEPIGMIERSLAPGCPLTSSLMKSPLFEEIMPTQSGPSTLRPFENKDGEKKYPLKLALEKLESPMIQFDEDLVKRCALRMLVDYSKKGVLQWYGSPIRGKLNDDENIRGVEDDQWIKPVNMKTSPGYPYVLAGDKRKYLNPETAEMQPVLLRAMREREDAARRGQEYPALMVDVLKDERLSNEKREKGKVRIFNVCPLDFNLLVRKYFTRFMAQMMSQHVLGEVSVGLNVHGDDWQAFFTCLEKSGSHWIAGDYSAWDKRMPLPIALALLPLVEHFYKQFDDYDPVDAVVRKTLLLQAFQSVRLAQTQSKGLVYRVHQSMPSGIAVTAVYNSLINALLFRVVYAELAVGNGLTLNKAVNTYHSNVRFAAYGDDHVARVSEAAYPWFNMLTIAAKMKEHNITYTAATKGDVEGPEVELDNLTYLKRKFVKRAGRLDAPMDVYAIIDILNWVNVATPLDAAEASAAAIKSVIIELSHHSKDVFDYWYGRILKAALRKGIDVPIVNYDEVVIKRRSETFDYYDDFY
nr:MAG: RNA-dependent RNA polymerase [Longquan rodent picorna-like virus 1]